MLQAGRLQVQDPMRLMIFFFNSAALGPGVYSASNRNEYQKQNTVFLGSRAWPVCKADNFTAICLDNVGCRKYLDKYKNLKIKQYAVFLAGVVLISVISVAIAS
jgi:hypothetical protein